MPAPIPSLRSHLEMRAKPPTIDDVAREAGVSKATVSAVINSTGSIGQDTRDRVLEIVERLNYRPSGARGNARRRGGKSIGIVIREQENPFYSDVVAGARSVVEELGYTVLVASSEGRYEAERRAVDTLREHDVSGLLLYPVLTAASDLSHLFDLKRRNFPFVLLEAVWGVQANLIETDSELAAQQAAEYLISLGHTRIVHFAGPAYSMHSKQRINGTYRAFSGSKISFTGESVIEAGAHIEDGYRAGLRYFRKHRTRARPTGVTCFNDMVALGVCRALTELGLTVPGDVSVIGYDDIPFLGYLHVPLTSVRVPKFEIGKRAAQILLDEIQAPEAVPPQRVSFAPEIVVRESTRRLDAERDGRG